MLTRRRLRARAGLVSGIAAVIVLLSAVLGGMIASVSGASTAAARQTLADAAPGDGVIRLGIRLAEEPRLAAEQDDAVRDTVRATLGGRDAAIVISRDVIATRVPLAGASELSTIDLLAAPRIEERASLTAGGWPAEAGATQSPQIAVPAEAAAALGVVVGDVVELQGAEGSVVPFTVSGVIGGFAERPFSEAEGDAPLVIREEAFALLDTRPLARWTVAPDLSRLSAEGVDLIADGIPDVVDAIEQEPRARSLGVVIEGGLEETLAGIRAEARVAGAIVPVALLVVAGAGALAVIELARSLAAARTDEVALLRSRGASARQLIAAAAIDWSIIALPSALAGAAAGALIVPLTNGLPGAAPTMDDVPLVGAIAAAVGLAALVAGTAAAARVARAPLRRESLGEQRRERRAVDVGALLLVGVLAAIALIAFTLAGGPVTVDPSGVVVVEPVAVLAPALVLFAGALLGAAALRPLLGLLARSTRGRRGAGAAIASMQLARRVGAFAVPALLVAVAGGSGIVAAAYDASAAAARGGARALALGADVRVSQLADDASAEVLVALNDLGRASSTPVDAATPVVTSVLSVAEAEAALVALDAASIGDVVAANGGTVDRSALRAAIEPEPVDGIAMPASSTEVTLAVRVVPSMPVQTAVWLMDAQGAVVRVATEAAAGRAATGTVTAGIPDGAAGADADSAWRLVAVDVRPVPAAMPADGVVTIAVGDVGAGEGAARQLSTTSEWGPRSEATRSFPGTITPATPGADGGPTAEPALRDVLAAVRIEATRVPDQAVRLMAEPTIPPIAITSALAERTALRVGDELRARTASVGRPVVGRVAGTVDAVPGSSAEEAIAVDLAAFTHHQLATTMTPPSPDQYWLAVPEDELPAVVADVERSAPGAVVEAVAAPPAAPMLDAVRGALWAAAASAGIVALASVIASAAASRRQRSAEVVVLRALGRRPALQARDRAVELAVLLASSVVAGAGAGVLAASSTVRQLARAIVLGSPTALRIDLVLPVAGLAAGALAIVAIVVVLAASHGAAVARQARRLSASAVLR